MLAHTTVNSTYIGGNTDQSTSTCIEVFDALGRFFKWYRDVSNEHLHVLVPQQFASEMCSVQSIFGSNFEWKDKQSWREIAEVTMFLPISDYV